MNLRKYFGHRTDMLNKRLYFMISKGVPFQRIYIDKFIEDFYMPLFQGTPFMRANWLFSMLHFDGDGYLHATDLVEAQRYADPLSDFGLEVVV